MNKKTFHALLLSLVMVTGVMTINDAYAQTNTERLITVIDTTADTNAKVSALVDLWADFDSHFTQITNAINDISGDLSAVSEKVSMVSNDAMSVNSKVVAVESKLDTIVGTNAARAENSKMNYDGLNQMLPEIEDTVDQIAEDTNASLGAVSEKLDGLEGQLGQFTSTIATLQNEVEEIKNEVGPLQSSIQDRIGPAPVDLIAGKVTEGVPLSWYTQGLTSVPSKGKYNANFMFVCESDVFVQKATTNLGDDDDNDDATPSHIKIDYYPNPHSGNVNNEPLNATMKATLLKMTDTIQTRNFDNPIYSGQIWSVGLDKTDAPYQDTTLKAGSHTLLDSQFNYGGDNTAILNLDANFNLMELKAGNPLQFTSTVQDPRYQGNEFEYTLTNVVTVNWNALEFIVNTTKNNDFAAYLFPSGDGGGSIDVLHDGEYFYVDSGTGFRTEMFVTKAQLKAAEAYEVTVEYFSSVMDPKCIITPSKTAELDNTNQVTFVTPEIRSDGPLLTDYTATLGCDLNPAKINSIKGYLGNADGFNNYVTMDVVLDKEKKAEFTFQDNVSMIADEENLPIEFHGEDLTISGKSITGATLLIEIRYDTVTNGECGQVQ